MGLPYLFKQLLLASINQSQSWTSGQHNVREQLQPNAHRKDLLELSNTLTGVILSVARRDKELEGQRRSIRHLGELRARK